MSDVSFTSGAPVNLPGLSKHNPDILTCLANLSADEVFTPPKLANAMLDILPQELFESPETTFLDPFTKSGVFLREIASRLNKGLASQMPDDQKRVDHILTKQVFGLATSELTWLLARRSLYCSKKADGQFSICTQFDTPHGNVRYPRTKHQWDNAGKCEQCGANQKNYERGDALEAYAYPFIHGIKLEEEFGVNFDVIVGNPPYQLDTGGSGRQATPLYNRFVEQAKKLEPRYLTMVIPSRWFAGGMGLSSFRAEMLEDRRLRKLVDYTNSKDCFPGVSLSGGACFFLWQRDYGGKCEVTSIHDGDRCTESRHLDEFPVLVRHNRAVDVIHKVQDHQEESLASIVSSISPFGFPTSARGAEADMGDSVRLHSSKGIGYVPRDEVTQGVEMIDRHKVLVSQTTSEHAGEPNKDGSFRLLSTMRVLPPGEICTFSYIVLGPVQSAKEADNLLAYLKTKFVRFLILQAVSSIHLSREKFCFVPIQDFSRSWSDGELIEKYGLVREEIAFIDRLMREWE